MSNHQIDDNEGMIQWKSKEYVGAWKIGGNWSINVYEKPTDEQIVNTEKMFGWKWVEGKAQEK